MAVHLGTKCAAGAALLGSSRAAAEQWICTACPHCTAKPTSVHRSHEVSFFCPATRTTQSVAQIFSDVLPLCVKEAEFNSASPNS